MSSEKLEARCEEMRARNEIRRIRLGVETMREERQMERVTRKGMLRSDRIKAALDISSWKCLANWISQLTQRDRQRRLTALRVAGATPEEIELEQFLMDDATNEEWHRKFISICRRDRINMEEPRSHPQSTWPWFAAEWRKWIGHSARPLWRERRAADRFNFERGL
jgi:hypothetical protein